MPRYSEVFDLPPGDRELLNWTGYYPHLPTILLTPEDRAKTVADIICPHIIGPNVLDIGCGDGKISSKLMDKFKQNGSPIDVIPVDVKLHHRPEIQPHIIFDGVQLPMGDNTVNTSIASFVLHHTQKPERLLFEMYRVTSERIILLEDTPSGLWGKRYNHFADSLINMEFSNHPHSNRTIREWLVLLANIGRVVDMSPFNTIFGGLFFQSTMFVVDLDK